MITHSKIPEYAKNRHIVELEGDEANYTNAQILNVADGSPKDGPSHHFGGTVRRYTGAIGTQYAGKAMAEVVVYID